jgi:hypothetical protein
LFCQHNQTKDGHQLYEYLLLKGCHRHTPKARSTLAVEQG